MRKKFRGADGKLSISIEEVADATREEAERYYTVGKTYLYHADGRQYVLMSKGEHVVHFIDIDGFNLYMSRKYIGTHLPDVANDELALELTED